MDNHGDQGLQRALDFEGGFESLRLHAERVLGDAERLARKNDRAADDAFKDAESFAIKAACPELQMRAYYGHGEFLARCGAFSRANQNFLIAERNAWLIEKDPEEKVPRIRLAIVEVNIEAGRDEELKACFKNFKTATKSCSNLWDERHGVWVEFTEKVDSSGERLAARKRGSEKYFRSRLEAAKQRRREVR